MYWLDQLSVSLLSKIVLKFPAKVNPLSLNHDANQAQESCQECIEDKGRHQIHFVLGGLEMADEYRYSMEEISNIPIRSYIQIIES